MKNKTNPAVLRAGLIHLLTASGALVALAALQAIYQGDARAALLWLLLALVIDGLDGPLARRFDVKKHLPQIDGTTLDLIVDFLSYVFVPVAYVLQFGLLPPGLAWPLCSAIVLSSLYLFVYTEMKSEDNYFNGFPAAWNLVLAVWVILGTPLWFNGVCTVVLCILTFVPIKSVHPVRVERFHLANLVLVALWIGLAFLLVATGPEAFGGLRVFWAAITAWFVGFSFWRTAQG